ncbi:hypothetical protein TNCV_449031 [Trichonephila clavipes]|nr:hypothetical protein TNCV_449031 [Trichonephila clavipes]
MLKPLRFDIFELQETKLPVRLFNTTNERRLVRGHETTESERKYRRRREESPGWRELEESAKEKRWVNTSRARK